MTVENAIKSLEESLQLAIIDKHFYVFVSVAELKEVIEHLHRLKGLEK